MGDSAGMPQVKHDLTPCLSHLRDRHEQPSQATATVLRFNGSFDEESRKRDISFGFDRIPNWAAAGTLRWLKHLHGLFGVRFGDLTSFSTVAYAKLSFRPLAVRSAPPDVAIPPYLEADLRYDNVPLRAQSGYNTPHDLLYQTGPANSDLGSMSMGRLLLMFTCPDKGSDLLFCLVRRIKPAQCPDVRPCLECRMLVKSNCCTLAKISERDEDPKSFEIITALELVAPIQIVPLPHHKKLLARSLVFHTIIKGDVLSFPQCPALSPLHSIAPVPFQEVQEERAQPKKRRDVPQVSTTPGRAAATLKITVHANKKMK